MIFGTLEKLELIKSTQNVFLCAEFFLEDFNIFSGFVPEYLDPN
jgi:hypothetical protein